MTRAAEVAARLKAFGSRPTDDQKAAGLLLGIRLGSRTPEPVAALTIRRRLAAEAHLTLRSHEASESQLSYLQQVAADAGVALRSAVIDRDDVDAWVSACWAVRDAKALRLWRPGPGDVVEYNRNGETKVAVLSSISDDGQLHFKWGGGRTRPWRVTDLTRGNTPEGQSLALRTQGLAAASLRPSRRISHARMQELERWKVNEPIGATAIAAFEDALESAEEERPMQVVLEQHPELFSRVVTGNHGLWVIPQVELSVGYVADFLIAGGTSAGVSWTLVELERPDKPLLNRNGTLAREARGAVKQIKDWRDWLLLHAPHAQLPRAQGGLGLPYLHARSRGLVVVSRAADETEDPGRARTVEYEDANIEIRTYDWLRRTFSRPRYGEMTLDVESPVS